MTSSQWQLKKDIRSHARRREIDEKYVQVKCEIEGHNIVPMSFLYAGQLKCACEWKQTFIAHG